MPICALSAVYETSLKTGEPVGNVPWRPTCETTPLTEIVTVDGAAVVVVGLVPVGGAAEPGTTLPGVVVVGVVLVVVGVVVVGVVDVPPEGAGVPGVFGTRPGTVPCGVNGFFV